MRLSGSGGSDLSSSRADSNASSVRSLVPRIDARPGDGRDAQRQWARRRRRPCRRHRPSPRLSGRRRSVRRMRRRRSPRHRRLQRGPLRHRAHRAVRANHRRPTRVRVVPDRGGAALRSSPARLGRHAFAEARRQDRRCRSCPLRRRTRRHLRAPPRRLRADWSRARPTGARCRSLDLRHRAPPRHPARLARSRFENSPELQLESAHPAR